MNRCFATTAPGLDRLAREELRRLGIIPIESAPGKGPAAVTSVTDWQGPGEDSAGGAAFEGSLVDVYRANLHLRTVSRVLLRLGDFYAAAFSELRKKASRLEWETILRPGQAVVMHVTCHKSKLYHSDAVAERMLGAIADRLGKPPVSVRADEAAAMPDPPQLIVVRLVRDHCTISADSSGALLHRRGYRLATAKAPLRETLAAAMLLASGWKSSMPLLDPFCGSGTIPIEAALLAGNIPPGLNRKFAFMRWPGFQLAQWEELLNQARREVKTGLALPLIQASDRDAGAISISEANAARAGVEQAISFSCHAVSAIAPPKDAAGWVVTNPPYGMRISQGKDIRNLYAQLGNVLRAHCPGWQVAILCNDVALLGQVGIPLDTTFSTVNGGLTVRLGKGVIPG